MTPLASIWLKDVQSLRNLRRILREESVFKVVFIVAFALGIMAGFYLIFADGFRFLGSLGGASFMITRRLFSLFFLGLGAMLVSSNIVTSYSTLFRSRESTYLLTCPLSTRDLVTYKFLESAALSSWAFFFLVIPFAAAYAREEHLGVFFAVWTCVFSVPFVILCGAIGSLVGMAVVRWLPRERWFWLLATGLAVVGLVRVLAQSRVAYTDEATLFLNRIMPGLQLASHPLLPSSWTSEGILALTRGDPLRGFLFFCVLVSNTALLYLFVQWLGNAAFYSAYQRVAGAAAPKGRKPEILGWLSNALTPIPTDIRGMILKDIRSFLRDPLQWSQALIFFGLLAIYFASFRSFRYDQLPDIWRNLIVFLNIFSVASVICSLASRFVFPQLSLEGHSFWILGLAPTKMSRIVMTKFLGSASAMVAISSGLMLLATWMLHVEPRLVAVAVGVAVAISISVSALSVGLGALFLDLKQANPVAIISGFGGTLNLVLCLGYMLSAIVPFGFIWHWHVIGKLAVATFERANRLAFGWLVVTAIVSTLVPLWIGARSLTRREY